MNTLEYLNKNIFLNKIETTKSYKTLISKIKINIFEKSKKTKIINKHLTQYIEEINAVLFKNVNIAIDKYENKESELLSAYVMTSNALFYYYNDKSWHGPFKEPLFETNEYHQILKMVINSKNKYYLSNGKLINLDRFLNYNTKATLNYIPGIGFPVISTDTGLKYSISKTIVIDKNNFENIDEKIIPEIFQENINIKYKPFYKLEHLENNDVVIRIFILDNKTPIEVFRSYLYENHTESFLRIGNEFIQESSSRDLKFLKKIKSGYIDEKIIQNTNAKYFIDILKRNHTERLPEKVLTVLKYPFIEKLYKSGWIKYANILCNNALIDDYALDRKIHELFFNTHRFYNTSLRKLEISNLFKLNKYQTEKLKTYSNKEDSIEQIIYYLKNCLTENLSSVDNKTFDITFDWVVDFYNRLEVDNKNEIKYLFHSINTLNTVFSLDKSIKIIEEFVETVKFCKSHEAFFSYYNDILNMLEEIHLLRNYNIKVVNEFQLERLHNEVAEIYNSMKREYENEKFIKKLDKIKDLEFENENYKIVIPKDCEDLINEGAALHHCVASYIRRIIDDLTNIVFLRKKSEPTKPFFTVEISNYKTIEQIHGFGNCNVEDEDLKLFIDAWTKEKELTLNNINKVR